MVNLELVSEFFDSISRFVSNNKIVDLLPIQASVALFGYVFLNRKFAV